MKILVIDTSPAVAVALTPRSGPFKPTTAAETRVVEYEPDYATARRTLSEHPERYDAVVVDPYPPDDLYMGAALVLELKATGVIVIVVTASWRVEECVHCMRAGAWDFIPKTRGLEAVADLVVSSLEAGLGKLPPPDADLQFVNNNLDSLCRDYGGLWIAVAGGGKFVEVAETYEDLRHQTEHMPLQPRLWRLPSNWKFDDD